MNHHGCSSKQPASNKEQQQQSYEQQQHQQTAGTAIAANDISGVRTRVLASHPSLLKQDRLQLTFNDLAANGHFSGGETWSSDTRGMPRGTISRLVHAVPWKTTTCFFGTRHQALAAPCASRLADPPHLRGGSPLPASRGRSVLGPTALGTWQTSDRRPRTAQSLVMPLV